MTVAIRAGVEGEVLAVQMKGFLDQQAELTHCELNADYERIKLM